MKSVKIKLLCNCPECHKPVEVPNPDWKISHVVAIDGTYLWDEPVFVITCPECGEEFEANP